MIRIGTRGSALALAQASIVARALESHGVAHEVVVVQTAGDRRAPDTPWGEGAFVAAIERALADGHVDIAVHSAKDIPTDEDARLHIGAYLKRDEPLDALVLPMGSVGTIDDLPARTVVGTDSPRRTGFLRARRPDLEVRSLHGNVDTRLRRLDEGSVDALLLAAAGLERLGRSERVSQLIPVDFVPPAPGQGAIAVQVRAQDGAARAMVGLIDHRPTRQAVEAERAFLRASGGGCRAPIGALATIEGDQLRLVGGFATLDGRAAAVERIVGPTDGAGELAERLAARLIELRARLPGAPRVLVTRPAKESRRIVTRLAELGVSAVVVPAIDIELLGEDPDLAAALGALSVFDWAVVTSANGARAAGHAARRLGVDMSRVRWAAVGHSTARELMDCGVREVWLPSDSNATVLADELPVTPGQRVLWVRGDLADGTLTEAVGARGADVSSVVGYRTVEAPAKSRRLLAQALGEGRLDAVILASPSAARGLISLAEHGRRGDVLAIPAICVGTRTAAASREAGFTVVGESGGPDAATVAELAAELLFQQKASQPKGVAT
jgi:hydroxymethylbilane synthase